MSHSVPPPIRPPPFFPCALLLFVVGWGANHFVALLPLYRARLQLSAAQNAAVFGLYALGVVPGLLGGGPLSDRMGRRRVAVPSALVQLLGSLVLAGSSNAFQGLLVGRFLVGLGAGATFSAGSAWLVDLNPLASGKRSTAAMASGFGAGPLFAGLIAELDWAPLLLPYIAQAAVLVASIVIVLRTEVPQRGPSNPQPLPPKESIGAWGFARRVVFVAPWVFTFPSLSFIALPSLFAAKQPASPVFVGVLAATTLFAGAYVARATAQLNKDSVAPGLVLGSLGLLCGAGAARAGLWGGSIIASLLLGSGYGWTMSMTFRFVATRGNPRYRGALVGLTYALTYVGFAAPYGLVWLARVWGDYTGLCIFSGLALLTATLVRPAKAHAEAS